VFGANAFGLAWLVGLTVKNEAMLTIIFVGVTIILLMAASGLMTGKNAYTRHVDAGFGAAMLVIMIACQAIL